MKINGRTIGNGKPVYIIAEMGPNYNGDVRLAIEMVELAKEAGADAIKLQIISADHSYVRSTESYAVFKKIELSKQDWCGVIRAARQVGIDIFATFVNAHDLINYRDVQFPVIKVSSTNLTNFPLLKIVAKEKKPVILSTGAAYLHEVEEAVKYLRSNGQEDIGLLQCTVLYPCPLENVHLNVMDTFRQTFHGMPVGYSDHTLGLTAALAAVVKGADIIEMHVTKDRNLKGPDHSISKTFHELKEFVTQARQIETLLGNSGKEPVGAEKESRAKWRRSLVALKPIQKGDILTEDHVGAKRSVNQGLEPIELENIIGKRAMKNINVDEPITSEVIRS